MENRVFILFFVIVFLSFLFSVTSSCVLHFRKKHSLKIHPPIWILLFLSFTIPLTFGSGLIEIQLFTDYTEGMRIEFHSMPLFSSAAASYLGDVYIAKQMLDIIRHSAFTAVMLWIVCTAAFLSFGMSSYFNSLHFLTKHSSECHDDKINKIFKQAKKTAGIRRNVVLRVVKSDIKISPCTCGTVFPTVFVGKDYLYGYSDTRLRLIFLHELMHIKHHHSLLKMITLVITSLFGLIPFAKTIRNAVIEDCEYLCDRGVMKAMGEDMIPEYMAMIIDVAEQNIKHRTNDALLSPVSEAGEMILKRYGAMKSGHKQKNGAGYILPIILAALLINFFCMSSVKIKSTDNLGVDIASPIMERALCEYFGVADPHELNEEHIASVYSIEFLLSEEIDMVKRSDDNRFSLAVIINEGLIYTENECLPFPGYPDDIRFSCSIIPRAVRADMFDIIFRGDSDAYKNLTSCYRNIGYEGSEHVPVLLLDGADDEIVMKYLRQGYTDGAFDVFLITGKTVDTRDIALFKDLRTLIFSDKLKSSQESIYTASDYAVINRK